MTHRVAPCRRCGSTEFRSLKALLLFREPDSAELNLSQSPGLKLTIRTSDLQRMVKKETGSRPEQFSFYSQTIAGIVLALFGLFVFFATLRSLAWQPLLLDLFFVLVGIGFITLARSERRRWSKSMDEWWARVRALSGHMVCLHCGEEWPQELPAQPASTAHR